MKNETRIKTKQENGGHFLHLWHRQFYGLPFSKVEESNSYDWSSSAFTTDPHPFDSMDIKVRVTPKQSEKLVKKAKAMGYKFTIGCENGWHEDMCMFFGSGIMKVLCQVHSTYHHGIIATELTYKQFMNGSIPKKKKPVEQPLKFLQWDVEIDNCSNLVKIGCKTFSKCDLKSALYVMNTINDHADIKLFRVWLDSNSDRLGLS